MFDLLLGSVEGFIQVDKVINVFSKLGCWVMLKNVYLVFNWLVFLEKKFYSLIFYFNFRLFLIMEINFRVNNICSFKVYEIW